MTEMEQELARLREENARLKGPRVMSLKVSEKTGAASLYGLGRFPVTLYKEQWAQLLGYTKEIQQFLVDNDSKLKTKKE